MLTPVMAGQRVVQMAKTLAAVLVLPGLLAACDEGNAFPTTCDRPESEEPREYTLGGIVDGVYWTSDWEIKDNHPAEAIVDGEPLYYPGGAYYRLHHNLNKIPDWWNFYLSFERDGLTEGKVAAAAGNQVEVESVDECTITIVNGTCTQYWLIGRVGQLSGGGGDGEPGVCHQD